VYYDLEDLYVRAGFAADEIVHRSAGRHVRELDQPRLEAVGWFLAGSACVADRLVAFNGIDRSSVFSAGLIVGASEHTTSADPLGGAVLCVGRHEFPKRTELVVAAAHLLGHRRFALVGTGGREQWARNLDGRLASGAVHVDELTDADLWCNTGRTEGPPATHDTRSNVEFAGRVSDGDLAARYAAAPCVVAPAYQEDYGLTAIEAMAQAKPVVVCRDGGGLTELVHHERTGLVVDPTPRAIAEAVERLCEDRDLAAELSANARDRAAELSWSAAANCFRDGIDRVRG
jgi:glycosyltransferase involved in cell wall biosynthesis